VQLGNAKQQDLHDKMISLLTFAFENLFKINISAVVKYTIHAIILKTPE